ncbi:MAG: MJ0042-type zinc finger domain-containing protein [Pseudomonadota bacterium]
MILTCPNCETQYFAEDDTIGDSGRTVKCTACDHSWFVRPDGAALDPEEGGEVVEGAHQKYRQQVRERRRQRSRLAALASWLVTASIFFALGAAAIVLRNDVVRIWPQAASAYKLVSLDVNRFGLEFEMRNAERTFDGTTPILTVTGEVRNVSRTEVQTPKVRVSLHDEFNREVGEMFANIAPRRLEAGAIGAFETQLENPPVESVSLTLQFVDIGGGRTQPQAAGDVSPESGTPLPDTPLDEPEIDGEAAPAALEVDGPVE